MYANIQNQNDAMKEDQKRQSILSESKPPFSPTSELKKAEMKKEPDKVEPKLSFPPNQLISSTDIKQEEIR